ncbi:hypothetical protein OROHE_015809 [Orobanche hederae]
MALSSSFIRSTPPYVFYSDVFRRSDGSKCLLPYDAIVTLSTILDLKRRTNAEIFVATGIFVDVGSFEIRDSLPHRIFVAVAGICLTAVLGVRLAIARNCLAAAVELVPEKSNVSNKSNKVRGVPKNQLQNSPRHTKLIPRPLKKAICNRRVAFRHTPTPKSTPNFLLPVRQPIQPTPDFHTQVIHRQVPPLAPKQLHHPPHLPLLHI